MMAHQLTLADNVGRYECLYDPWFLDARHDSMPSLYTWKRSSCLCWRHRSLSRRFSWKYTHKAWRFNVEVGLVTPKNEAIGASRALLSETISFEQAVDLAASSVKKAFPASRCSGTRTNVRAITTIGQHFYLAGIKGIFKRDRYGVYSHISEQVMDYYQRQGRIPQLCLSMVFLKRICMR